MGQRHRQFWAAAQGPPDLGTGVGKNVVAHASRARVSAGNRQRIQAGAGRNRCIQGGLRSAGFGVVDARDQAGARSLQHQVGIPVRARAG